MVRSFPRILIPAKAGEHMRQPLRAGLWQPALYKDRFYSAVSGGAASPSRNLDYTEPVMATVRLNMSGTDDLLLFTRAKSLAEVLRAADAR
jgi:hypothetical protein